VESSIDILTKNGMLSKDGKVYVCATDGPFPAHFVSLSTHARAKLAVPPLSDVVNPIGAGDATSAGLLMAWTQSIDETIMSSLLPPTQDLRGGDEEDRKVLSAFRFGLACGSASCLTNSNSIFRAEDVHRIYNDIIIT
jgi:fructose-1-phosphate kinase PfkB-like protein